MATRVTVKLPPRFYEDHVARDCAPGEVVKTTKRHVFVTLTYESYEDLLSDARHYSDPSSVDYDPYLLGLTASARATVKALSAVEAPEFDASLPRWYDDGSFLPNEAKEA